MTPEQVRARRELENKARIEGNEALVTAVLTLADAVTSSSKRVAAAIDRHTKIVEDKPDDYLSPFGDEVPRSKSEEEEEEYTFLMPK
jgi:hypothetical protein